MGKIDKATVDRIFDATNIVDVVSDFVSLKKRGSSYLGLCPFHNERTPSFSVSPAKGIFKCFSCGKAGSAVSFLMDLEGMTYVEAIKWLGRKYNIEVKEREMTGEERKADAEREAMFAANEFALTHFESTLRDTEDGRNIGLAYFRERGTSDAMIAKFHLGYSLEKSDDLTVKAEKAGFAEQTLIDTGLVIRTDRGTLYDRFKGRVIYPVHTLSGRVVAFGGRTLRKEKTVAKYVNSPESLIYSKSHELYGMYQARSAIAKKKDCILVEGYMDVISMHQAGVENVVASSGTSLTEGQIRMIKRFADSVTLIYDSDPAGIKASLRGIDMLLAAGLSLKVVLLPEGDDPDSFARSHTSSEVEEYIAAHRQDLIGFKADILLSDAGDDPRRRTEAINDILRSIAIIPDVVEQSLYLDECARKVNINSKTLALQLRKFVAARAEELHKKRQLGEARGSLSSPEAAVIDSAYPPEAGPDDFSPSVGHPQAPASAREPISDVAPPVRLAEEDLIRYVLKHGFMYMCEAYPDPEASESVPMSVTDYIESELKVEGLQFSYPLYRRLWEMTLEIRDGVWMTDSVRAEGEFLAERQKKIEEGLADIRSKDLDMTSIQAAEKGLIEQADAEYELQTDTFAASYVRRELLKCDDRLITDQVAVLTSEPVVLSKMYPKVDERSEALVKIPLAVKTFKSVVIKQRLQQITEALRRPGSPEEVMALMEEFRRLKQQSMELDNFTGEIVITP
ncbi:MAG: DNA primase [Muribaculaceae bacterium]|nr:DNA primase [Muribaculaceae bacterium]